MTRAKKSFGQHFLKSTAVIEKTINAAEITKSDAILEIGPGTGALTGPLLKTGAHIRAVETDKDLIPILKETFPALELIEGDVLQFTNEKLAPKVPYKLVANLPYNVGSRILRKFLSEEPSPTRMVVMLQKEVGERLLAKPGEMSTLSVAAQIYTDVKRVTNVPPGAFSPPPKVDSIVVQLDRKVKTPDPEAIIKLAKAGFTSRRKQLHKNLANARYGTSQEIKDILESLSLPTTSRAQELSLENWINLHEQFK